MASRQFQLQAYSGNPLNLCAVRGETTSFPALARGEGRLKIQKAARAIGESQLQCALLATSAFSFEFLNHVALRRLGWPGLLLPGGGTKIKSTWRDHRESQVRRRRRASRAFFSLFPAPRGNPPILNQLWRRWGRKGDCWLTWLRWIPFQTPKSSLF